VNITETPRLYFNTSAEDREAYGLLQASGIPCQFRCPAIGGPGLDENPTKPLLVIGYNEHRGIDEIRKWLNKKGGRK